MSTKQYSIKDVCAVTGLSAVYVRRMIQKGKIATTQIEIAKNTFKHMIDEDVLEAWRKTAKMPTRREDGRAKFNLYATAEELAEIEQLLAERNIETPVVRANKVKQVAS
jgi:peptidyl-tRNA hydrolase